MSALYIMNTFTYGIGMHHAVLYIGEGILHLVMDSFHDAMCLHEAQIIRNAYLHIHVDSVAEHSCVENVNMLHTGHSLNAVVVFVQFFHLSTLVRHSFKAFHNHLHTRIENHGADDKTGNGIEDRITKTGT